MNCRQGVARAVEMDTVKTLCLVASDLLFGQGSAFTPLLKTSIHHSDLLAFSPIIAHCLLLRASQLDNLPLCRRQSAQQSPRMTGTA